MSVAETPEIDGTLALLEDVARAALPRFGFSPRASLALLHHRENAVFRVDDPAEGCPWALRVHRVGYRTTQEIRSELAWMEALRADGVQTPRPRPGRDGDPVQTIAAIGLAEPRDVDVLSWVEGSPLDAASGAEAYRLLGRTCACIQQQARSWVPPAGFARPTWDAASLVGKDAHWGDYAELAALAPEQRALMDRAAAIVFRRLDRFGKGPDRFGLTHGDLMPDNVLVHRGTPSVIDFDDSGYGWYLYDLATLLAVKLFDPDQAMARDAWVEGYRSAAPLPEEHLEELDTLVMARGLLLLGWMHTRRETPTARLLTGAVIGLACVQAEKLLARERG
jgi:Ser/Thr protein kinase RdoA (MazF antagonist)